MKKRLAAVGSVMLAALVLFSLSACSRVEITGQNMVAVFQYGDVDSTKPLSAEDAETVKSIFNKKTMYSDMPACGFSENMALLIDGKPYCIAQDTCGAIYNVEAEQYFYLSESENTTLRSLLEKYGFIFHFG